MKLKEGSLNDHFDEKFECYLDNFDYLLNDTNPIDINTFKKIIFEGLDMRKRISIIEKCTLLHSLLNKNNEKTDYSIMCIEIFLELLHYFEIDFQNEKNNFHMPNLFARPYNIHWQNNTFGLDHIRNHYNQLANKGTLYYASDSGTHLIRANNIWGIILGCYRFIIGFENDTWYYGLYDKNKLCHYTKKYWDLMQIIN